MQRLSLTLLVCFSVFIFSCHHHKPDPIPTPNPDPGPTDTTGANATRLVKTVLTSGTDATTMTYQYDAQNRLVWFSNTSTKAGYFEDTSSIIRENNGIINQIVYRSDTSHKFNDPKVDSIVYNVNYDAASSRYTYKLLKYKMFTTSFKDSTFYAYDAQGRIVTETTNYFDFKTKTYLPAAKNDYTYDAAGNLATLNTIYYNVGNGTDYPFQITYTYDAKGVNLLNLGNEGIVLGLTQSVSAHTPLTMVSTYPQNSAYNRSYSYVYTYNTKYRPLKADITDAANGNAKSTMVFIYQ